MLDGTIINAETLTMIDDSYQLVVMGIAKITTTGLNAVFMEQQL